MKRFFPVLIVGALVLEGCGGLAHVEPSTYPAPARNAITFWGHACSYIDVNGTGIVLDPVFDKSLYQRRRFIGSPPAETLRDARVVLISHAHDDHTSPASLRLFPKGTVILCPKPTAEFLNHENIEARAMSPGEAFALGDVRITAVAVFHPGKRKGLQRGIDGRALGWIVVTPAATIFYSGDSDYCSAFSDVGWRYAPDVAIINVNGHLKPPDAARAAADMRARVVIPTHWGGYGYWFVGGNRHPRGEKELARLLGNRLHVLHVGESFLLEKVPGPK
jgi:L-ascorbate metabolism protein UlaG (beta-lactamase superfamily)